MSDIKYILTDIEGTTTSVSFVYDKLFPYFRARIWDLTEMMEDHPEVAHCFEEVIDYVYENERVLLLSNDEIIDKLLEWSQADLKLTPLKTLQGILWRKGYESGALKGDVYPEVAASLKSWKSKGIQLGVFSSGSIEAQQLIFGYSVSGDLRPVFSHYFDTRTGGKRDASTYRIIADNIGIPAENILFLSDVKEELEAAQASSYQTIQLVRPGTKATWPVTATDFNAIHI